MNRRLCQADVKKRGKKPRRPPALPQYDEQAERAAIMEFDGGLSREDAEDAAAQGIKS